MNRTPPTEVIRQLRSEVGFGCPVPDCGNPYLAWHHFDPPWRTEQHHNPAGMIALCAEHHNKADHGAYTIDQLSAFKRNKADPKLVRGRFDWRRNKLLIVVGGNFYYECLYPLVIDGHHVVSVTRDDKGYLQLNVNMLSLSCNERVIMIDNVWQNIGSPTDLVSPPSGKQLIVTYSNGDHLRIDFSEVSDAASFEKRFQRTIADRIKFPLTIAEVNLRIGGTGIALTPRGTTISTNTFFNCFFSHHNVGFYAQIGLNWRQNQGLTSD